MNTTTATPPGAPSEVLILTNGCFHTVDRGQPQASAVAIADGKFLAVGDSDDVMRHRTPTARVIDLQGRTVIPA